MKKDTYSMSFNTDFRTDGDKHELELDYWDSDDVKAHSQATSNSFEECMDTALTDVLKQVAAGRKNIEDKRAKEIKDNDKAVDNLYAQLEDLQNQLADLEAKNEKLKQSNDMLRFATNSKPKKTINTGNTSNKYWDDLDNLLKAFDKRLNFF